jgi:uncharacterized protein
VVNTPSTRISGWCAGGLDRSDGAIGEHDGGVRRTLPLLIVTITAVAACSGGDDAAPATSLAATTAATTAGSEPAAVPPTTAPTTAPATAPTTSLPAATFEVRSGVEQVTVTGAEPGERLRFVRPDGTALARGEADAQGALVVRRLPGGEVLAVEGERGISDEVIVMPRDAAMPASFYAEQRLPTEGLGYIETRDGTTLSASVWLPGPADAGPYPTVVEYSGYTPSDPESEGFPDILNGLGYAYVGVNIRGTGCSGGSFRYFEYTQSTDGYDAIEAVAAQPWVLGNRVGMVGVSYPGISQLFVAQTQPPSLAAITPFSVVADSTLSTLYPGGILNTGFAVEWTAQRMADAEPLGQGWAADRVAAGDEVCEANQELRGQNPDLLAEISATRSGPTSRQPTSHRACSSIASPSRRSWPAPGRTSRPAATSPPCSTASPAPIISTRRSSTASTPSRSARRCSRAGSSSSTSTSPSAHRRSPLPA